MRETLNHEQATKLQTEEEKNTKNELVKLGKSEKQLGLQLQVKVSKLFMEAGWEVSTRLPTSHLHRILKSSSKILENYV